MPRTSRFDCASSVLTLRGLLTKTRRAFWVCLAVGIAAHLSLSQIRALQAEQKAAKPLTTQFVKRQPRLTKPLELKKRPAPRRRQIRRTMVAVKARMGRQDASSRFVPTQVVQGFSRPRVQVARTAALRDATVEPQALAQAIQGSREAKQAVDMSLELLDVETLDTGQYQAMVIQDPDDKRTIKGYVHLAVASPFSVRNRDKWTVETRVLNGVQRLLAKLNEWTDIKASVAKRITFDTAELFQTPWVYLSIGYSMEPTRGEVDNLGKYLLNGGFFFFEGDNSRERQGQRHLARFVKSALESQGYRQGVDWEYQFLLNTHPVFHSYYDFPSGAPPGGTVLAKFMYDQVREDGVEPWSRGIEMDGRLVALNTNQGYYTPWSDYGHSTGPLGSEHLHQDPTLCFQFGINTIIFALTQEGSITHRLMESMR